MAQCDSRWTALKCHIAGEKSLYRNQMKKLIFVLMIGFLFAFVGCRSGDIRGSSKPSQDGKTYLIVADDNGGTCPLKLDGKLWTHPKGEAALIVPGHHTLSSCGSDIGFVVQKGVVYTFD